MGPSQALCASEPTPSLSLPATYAGREYAEIGGLMNSSSSRLLVRDHLLQQLLPAHELCFTIVVGHLDERRLAGLDRDETTIQVFGQENERAGALGQAFGR